MTLPRESFPAMGGIATVVVDGPRASLDTARRRLLDLESRWSRFRPVSEVSRLNAARRTPLPVSADTRLLVRCAVTAWERTHGAFDPSVLDALVAWGYDRDLVDIALPERPLRSTPAPGLATVVVDETAGTVDLGGAGFDPGGIGKGLAADLVATELVDAGAEAALVSVAGDLRIAGRPPGGTWTVGLEDPGRPDHDLLRIALPSGAVATSSDRRRRWRTAGQDAEAHHLIDPSAGSPGQSTLAGVSVLAAEAWWAEALTKAVLLGRVPIADLGVVNASGIGRSATGEVVGTPDLLALTRTAA